MIKVPNLRSIAIIGPHPSRRCGIATFSSDLQYALSEEYPDCAFFTVGVTECTQTNGSASELNLLATDLQSYHRLADELKARKTDLICLQHEYGIFNGLAGGYILALLRRCSIPVVTTLHTVLRHPDPNEILVMNEIISLSERLVVMSGRSAELLSEVYRVSCEKIVNIPHGVPDLRSSPNSSSDLRKKLGLENKIILLTFGLLSPNKGIETVILAMPQILKSIPKAVYVVVGSTHPNVLRECGDEYRRGLKTLVSQCDVEKHVIFYEEYVSTEELAVFLGTADIYVSPHKREEQVVSGTLTYAFASGIPIIATPYWHAQELLAGNKGVLVPFASERELASSVVELANDPDRRAKLGEENRKAGREWRWSKVAREYMRTFSICLENRKTQSCTQVSLHSEDRHRAPDYNLRHFREMTDSVGILQHAMHTVPNYLEGYTTDDNARALILAVLAEDDTSPEMRPLSCLSRRFLAFLWYSYCGESGRIRNFLSYNRDWRERIGSECSHGRALWALGTLLSRSQYSGLRQVARDLFDRALPASTALRDCRAWSFVLMGTCEALRSSPEHPEARAVTEDLANRLIEMYLANSVADWRWFEYRLTFFNARIPHALLLASRALSNERMEACALESLEWLTRIQTSEEGLFRPIGCNGFYDRGGARANYDQQPVDACATVSACLYAFEVTGSNEWKAEALRAFDWFLGFNDLGLPLYNSESGGCRDGLHHEGVNHNEGAESTISFLLSLVEIRRHLRSRDDLCEASDDFV